MPGTLNSGDNSPTESQWPRKHRVFGVGVSATSYEDALERIIRAAKHGVPATVDHMSLHGLTEFCSNPVLRSQINTFDLVAPDGQPVRWTLDWLHRTKLSDRVYGPELMTRLCARAATDAIPIYLYGSTPDILDQLCSRLTDQYPSLQIVGVESPPFRPLTPEEDTGVVERINRSGARLVFIGLGCPKQELFAYEHRERIKGVQICVGAAFDFLGGNKKMAPGWMQQHGLEWFYRLLSEPKRLWRRYLFAGSRFLVALGRELALGIWDGSPDSEGEVGGRKERTR